MGCINRSAKQTKKRIKRTKGNTTPALGVLGSVCRRLIREKEAATAQCVTDPIYSVKTKGKRASRPKRCAKWSALVKENARRGGCPGRALPWRLLHLLQDAVEGTSVVASPPNSKSARPEDKGMVTVSRVAWLGGGFWLCSV